MSNSNSSLSKPPLGQVYWITGLAGTGKTTIGTCLYDRLKAFVQRSHTRNHVASRKSSLFT